ncbi:pilus assembly protein TadG-related protein [Methylobacterium oryzisoli]|uniref:pilus assembly protein TadG-related protein n=1 Tax=Methylobacterium oryzisoli TaxID=3385502 RepID=UPI0038928CEB
MVRDGLAALRRFARERAANVALIFALSLPLLFGAVGLTVDYVSWQAQAQRLQKAADAAALAVVSDMQVSSASQERIQSVAEAQVRDQVRLAEGDGPVAVHTLPVSRTRPNGPFEPAFADGRARPPSGVTVTLTQPRRALMSRFVTPHLADIAASATAEALGAVKVCVVALDAAGAEAVRLRNLARIEAGGCSVYALSSSASALKAEDLAVVTSAKACAVGGYAGGTHNFRPAPVTACPPIKDPLAERVAPPVGGCTHTNLKVTGEVRTLSPGTYCGGLTIDQGAQVTLNPGVYVIKDGPLVVGPGDLNVGVTLLGAAGSCSGREVQVSVGLGCLAKVTLDTIGSMKGTQVGFYFTGTVPPDPDGVVRPLQFRQRSVVEITAPLRGDMAGLLFHEDRGAAPGRLFEVKSDSARRLVGTIYLPRGTFVVNANQVVADQSEYTAVVARRIDLSQAPRLVINTNYGGTDVPVPKGLGPWSASAALTE